VGTSVPSIDAGLNLTWAMLSLGVLLCWRAEWIQGSRRTLVAILCVVVLLFPVISAADDLTEVAQMYDLSVSPLSVRSGNEIKQVVAPAPQASQPVHGAVAGLFYAIVDAVQSQSVLGDFCLLLTSSSGIHSPPQL
jgi:hypothetical protein